MTRSARATTPLALLVPILVACGSGPTAATTPAATSAATPGVAGPLDPKAFVLGLIDALKSDDVERWRAHLSRRMRAGLEGDGAVQAHMDGWKPLVDREAMLRSASCNEDPASAGDQPHWLSCTPTSPPATWKVVHEEGAIRLDEN